MGQASCRNRQNFGGLVGERAMSLFRNFATGLRSLFRKNQIDRELDEELGAYLEMEAAEKMRQGVSRKDALREVRLERGSLEVTKELVRSGGWEFFVETCWQDLRFAIRMLRKSPAFTRSEEHTSELQSQFHLVCRLLLEKKKKPTLSITERNLERRHHPAPPPLR